MEASNQTGRLEAQGLVSRAADPRDGRAVLVRSTRAGAARHRGTKQTARAVYATLFAGWPDGDLQQVAHVAARLVETLEQPRDDAALGR